MYVMCSSCGNILSIDNKYAGIKGTCRKCNSPLEVPKAPPAIAEPPTSKQLSFAEDLGFTPPSDITKWELSRLLDVALERQQTENYDKLNKLQERAGDLYEEIRNELTTPKEIIEAFEEKGLCAILITFDKDKTDIDDIVGAEVRISHTDWLKKKDVAELLQAFGYQLSKVLKA